ncbi:MAG: metal-sulfur cluster assembly factor [Caldilineales bacterium]|nr:metal-sulfur cluster assembly factor [Caldilineales bacterium]MDW8317910.1 metal-sulfur cluster assembly factor [Anaerolineae bacterium]
MSAQTAVHQALRTVVHPLLGQNLVDLGLVLGVDVSAAGHAVVTLTLTTPHCPAADRILEEARQAILSAPGVASAEVRWAWDPPWTPYRMAKPLREALGLPDAEPPLPPSSAPGSPWARWRQRLRRLLSV